MPTQIILQSGPRVVAASEQELCGAAGGAVNQPHRQLQDRRAGNGGSGGGQVSQTHLGAALRLTWCCGVCPNDLFPFFFFLSVWNSF